MLLQNAVSDTPALISKLDFTYKFDSRWVHESLVPGGASNRDRKRETSSVDVAELTLFASQADKVTLDDDVSHSIVDPCDVTFSMRKEKNFGERGEFVHLAVRFMLKFLECRYLLAFKLFEAERTRLPSITICCARICAGAI